MPTRAKKPTLLDHVVLEVRDLQASVDFYRTILRFPPVRLTEYRRGVAPFVSVRVNDAVLVDLFPRAMWINRRRPVNPNHVCFTMSEGEVTALKRRLVRHKVAITRRLPVSFGAQGWGDSIYFADPDGVTLEVRFYGPNAKASLSAPQLKAQAATALAGIADARRPGARPSAKGGKVAKASAPARRRRPAAAR